MIKFINTPLTGFLSCIIGTFGIIKKIMPLTINEGCF